MAPKRYSGMVWAALLAAAVPFFSMHPGSFMPPYQNPAEPSLYLLRSVSSVLISGEVLGSSSRAIAAIQAILAALCLCPSATTPPPISVLLQTNGELQFERTVERLSTSLFLVLSSSNPVQFQPLAVSCRLQSAEGRNALPSTKYQQPSTRFRLSANC
jgi:hypothetical protein